MNLEPMSDNNTETEIFIPVFPDKSRRFGMMVSQAMPGFVLAISVAGTDMATVGNFLLNAFCLVSGVLVIFFAVREYKFPGNGRKPGTDMVTVFTGLLVIAQGSQIFDALKGFQPAHLYFSAGALFIFKGVMLPESKIRRGFIISHDTVVYKRSLFRSSVKISGMDLADIYLTGNTVNFLYKSGDIKMVSLKGEINPDEMVVLLKKNLLPA
jgi:hypothetical protein